MDDNQVKITKILEASIGESNSSVVGYSIHQAESWDKVQERVTNYPHLMMGNSCEVEVHEVLPLPGM